MVTADLFHRIGTEKTPCRRIIIPTLEVIHPDLGIIVISAISEGVRVGDMAHVIRNVNACAIGDSGHLTPCVVGIPCNNRADLVCDLNDITLQVLVEIVSRTVVDDTADRILVVVQRNQGTVAPGFFQDLGAVELVGVQYTVNRLARADAVGIVLFLLYNKLQALSILGQYRNPAGAQYMIGAAGNPFSMMLYQMQSRQNQHITAHAKNKY